MAIEILQLHDKNMAIGHIYRLRTESEPEPKHKRKNQSEEPDQKNQVAQHWLICITK